jgi:hypothetical protein
MIDYEHATSEFEVKRLPSTRTSLWNACNSFMFHLRSHTSFKEAAEFQAMLEKYAGCRGFEIASDRPLFLLTTCSLRVPWRFLSRQDD